MSRVYNFSAGPAVLPEEVVMEAAEEMPVQIVRVSSVDRSAANCVRYGMRDLESSS